MTSSGLNDSDCISAFQLTLAILSIFLLAALFVNAVGSLPHEISRVLQFLDLVVCSLLFFDVCNRYARSTDKRRFMRWAWLDLLACIPMVDWLRFGRLARLTRVILILRTVRVGHRLVETVMESKRRSAAASAILMTILLVVSASITMLLVERGETSNIRTAEDAVWWSITTITTVGYGDKYPVTFAGRAVAVVLMVSGVGLFGVMGGLVASLVIGNPASSSRPHNEELSAALTKLEEIDRRLALIHENGTLIQGSRESGSSQAFLNGDSGAGQLQENPSRL